jgi:hypothetical protein
VQALAPERQHDLARIICALPPLQPASPPSLNRLAADLRAVAIEISQRRTFQERYTGDLQAAIDAGSPESSSSTGANGLQQHGRTSVKAAFVPPPSYEDASDAGSSARPSPHSPAPDLPPTAPLRIHHRRTPSAASAHDGPGPGFPVPTVPTFGGAEPMHRRTTSGGGGGPQSPALLSPSYSSFGGAPPLPDRPSNTPQHRAPSPSLLAASSAPAIELIRETLYASLADVLSRTPSLRALLRTDPPRAYFGSVALAVLDVATSAVTREGSVVGVLGAELTREACPPPLRPLMDELAAIGAGAREMEEADSVRAVEALTEGREVPAPRLERVRTILEEGVGRGDAIVRSGSRDSEGEGEEGRRSVEGRAVAFANRINGLALRMTQLRPFRERQEEVFRVLAGVTG